MRKKPLPDPSLPLANFRYEEFCKFVLAGENLGESYKKSTPHGSRTPANDNVAKVSANRIGKRAEVIARIAFLQGEQNKRELIAAKKFEPEKISFSKADVLELFMEVSATLHRAYLVAQTSSVSQLRLEQLRKTLGDNTARLAKYQESAGVQRVTPLPDGEINTMIARMDCTCQ